MAKSVKLQEVAIDLLRPYERNAKIHPSEQVEKIKRSIEEFGFVTPCVIDGEYNLIAGHGRVQAAKEMGLETVPCVFVEGLSEAQRKAYILADNRLGELGEWDMETVSDELEELKDSGFDIDLTGFSIDNIIIEDDFGADLEEDFDSYETTPSIVKAGEVWKLGDHRLMCGDSTVAEDVDRLMGSVQADLLLTDPPYNVSLGHNEGAYKRGQRKHKADNGLLISNDSMPDDDFYEFLKRAFTNASDHMKYGASYYCWYGGTTEKQFRQALEDSDLIPHQTLIWVKNTGTIGRTDYQYRHEPCFYGWKEGGAHYFIDARTLTTVTDDLDTITKEEAIERLKEISFLTTAMYEKKPNKSPEHPTMKPLSIFKKQIRNSSREGGVVMDLFGGSGTTILACEEMGRVCYMMEYDPHFCDVIINRWEEATGLEAVRE